MYASLCRLDNFGVSLWRSSREYVAHQFVLASSVVPSLPRSSYLDALWDGRQVAVQLLFCGVLLPGLVQNSMQHSYVVPISFFSNRFARVQVMQPYNSTDTATDWKNFCSIISERSYFQMIEKQCQQLFHFRFGMHLTYSQIIAVRFCAFK